MSSTNKKKTPERKFTAVAEPEIRLAGGAGQKAAVQGAEALLRRSVMTCLLWEPNAYRSGEEAVQAISSLVPQVDAATASRIAIEARKIQGLRHVPLWVAKSMLDAGGAHKAAVEALLPEIILRADQATEFLSLLWSNGGKRPKIPAVVRKGLGEALNRMSAYTLTKYQEVGRDVDLKSVIRLVHTVPKDQERADLYKAISKGEVKSPPTWEVRLSAGEDAKTVFSEMIEKKELGGMAVMRNIRQMEEKGVPHPLIRKAITEANARYLNPLNFFAARKHSDRFSQDIENKYVSTLESRPKLPGHTVFVVDLSGSMGNKVSTKSEFTRMDVACILASAGVLMCERATVYATAGSDSARVHKTKRVKAARGMVLAENLASMYSEMGHGGIFTRQCLDYIREDLQSDTVDRIVVISDSQDCDTGNRTLPNTKFAKTSYIIDVSCEKHGVNYAGVWTAEISGWSDKFLDYVAAYEGLQVGDDEE